MPCTRASSGLPPSGIMGGRRLLACRAMERTDRVFQVDDDIIDSVGEDQLLGDRLSY
jgi:hypothetical protein